MRRKRMHGKRRRRSSCKPSPLKHIISMYKEDQHPHNKDGSHPTETKKETRNEAVADPNFDPSASYITQDDSVRTKTKTKTKSASADDTLDNIQEALNYGGLSPGYGIFADLANVGISAGRSLYGLATGDYEYAKHHAKEGMWHGGSAIPFGIGQGIATVKIGKKGINLSKKAKRLDTSYPNVIKDRTIEAEQVLDEVKSEGKAEYQPVGVGGKVEYRLIK